MRYDFAMSGDWEQAKELLQALIHEATLKPITSISPSDDGKHTSIASPMSGFSFEAKTSWLLNNSIIVEFQAERSYLFGLFFRSIYSIVEFSPDGDVETNPVYSRFETRFARQTRRNWGQGDA